MASLRSLEDYLGALDDHTLLQGAFGPRILPMDMDGFVERNFLFLFVERKRFDHGDLDAGHFLALSHLKMVDPDRFTVWYLRAEPYTADNVADWTGRLQEFQSDGQLNQERVVTFLEFYNRCTRWYARAEAAAGAARIF